MRSPLSPKMRGRRTDTDPSDAAAWLSLFQTAITAGKTTADAITIADAGAHAYRVRFPGGTPAPASAQHQPPFAQQRAQNPAPSAPNPAPLAPSP